MSPVSPPPAVRPAALRPGDRVMLVSPSGPTRPDRVARGVELLTGWGLSVVDAPHVYARSGYLAGTDEQRLADLMTALADPTVRGVVCTRGGYGVQRIVDGIDMAVVRADPKIVVGFSDITALQLALWRGARLASVHGPGAAWLHERTGPDSVAALRHALMDPTPVTITARPDEETSPVRLPAAPVTGPAAATTPELSGVATGPLLGGNLCLLAASVGTPDLPDLTGAILLIEDVGEPPYKVDRMLTHLRRAGVLDKVAGVAVGQFTDCADDWSTTIVDCLLERLSPLGVPVLGGLPIGHGRDQIAVPFGTLATLDVPAATLTVAPVIH